MSPPQHHHINPILREADLAREDGPTFGIGNEWVNLAVPWWHIHYQISLQEQAVIATSLNS
jgi:hypothetical protein